MALTESKSNKPLRPKRWMLMALVLAIGFVAQQSGIDLSEFGIGGAAPDRGATSPFESRPARSQGASADSVVEIERAYEARRSGFMITVDARVDRLLPDDNEGSRHQKFLIELESGRRLLVAHNIDLAKRVPMREGDIVRVRGQYEWNKKGGVLHWTHHDPDGSHEGGWIEFEGRRIE